MSKNELGGNERGGIISGLLTILGLLVLAAIVGTVYMARNVHVQTTSRGNGGDVSIEIPGGHLSIKAHETMDPAAMGIPMYPGARRKGDSGGASFQWSSSDGKADKGLSIAAGEMITQDSADKVLAWYKSQLPNWAVVVENDKLTHVELKEGGYKRFVAIKDEHDGTHIAVASVGEPASN